MPHPLSPRRLIAAAVPHCRRLVRASWLADIAWLAGCSVGPAHHPPEMTVPVAGQQADTPAVWPSANWRHGFDSVPLDPLIGQAQRTYDIAQAQLHAGTIDIFTVLNTQGALFSAHDPAMQAEAAHLQALAGLFEALGGGWTQQAKVS